MSSRLFPLWMGIEQSHFGENRIIVPRQPHLDENPMTKSLDGEDHLVIEPVVLTVPLVLQWILHVPPPLQPDMAMSRQRLAFRETHGLSPAEP